MGRNAPDPTPSTARQTRNERAFFTRHTWTARVGASGGGGEGSGEGGDGETETSLYPPRTAARVRTSSVIFH